MSVGLRGLQVLETLAGMQQPAPLRLVASRVRVSEAQTFRVLRSLEEEGYVEHLGRSGYRIASRSVALAMLIGPRPAVRRVLEPAVARLAARTREAVVLHLRTGASRVLVLGLPAPTGPIRDPGGVLGERSPLGVGASGRVILAYLGPGERPSEHPVDDAVLARVRERGYEMSFGENHPGINGVSGALLTSAEVALGSITIAGPAERLTPAVLEQLARPLLATCREVSPAVASLLGPDPGAVVEALDL